MKKYIFIISLLLVIFFLSIFPLAAQAANVITVVFNKLTSYALKDPFYPDYPQRRILFSTTDLPWWGNPGLTKYKITSIDPRIGNQAVTFYSSGSYPCPNGLEMGLPVGNAPGSCYNHYPCTLSASDDFNFLFPFKPTTTNLVTLDSPARIISDEGLNAIIYLPLSWWNN